MPDVSGASAVNTGVHTHYQYAHTRLRVHWAPGIPRALCFEGHEEIITSGPSWLASAKVCLELTSLKTATATKRSISLYEVIHLSIW
jgi:hypothetical protein